MRRFSLISALLGGALFFLPTISHAQDGLFDALAGPGGTVTLKTGSFPDGKNGSMRTLTNADGTFKTFEAMGSVNLDSPKITLRSTTLVYDGETGLLVAEGNVYVEQGEVKASCERMEYTVETEEILLTGTPEVEQTTAKEKIFFSGMDRFVLTKNEDGSTEVHLSGDKDILCKTEQLETTETPTNTPDPSEKAEGLSALGSNVQILTRPRANKMPVVQVSTTEAGGLGIFRAEGAVLLESDSMNLRSDVLEFNGVQEVVEALYNVYVKQERIDADCGRMEYDLSTGKIVLTVDPVVREQRPDGLVNISEMDMFIITKNEDGTSSTEAVGGDPRFVYQKAEDVGTNAPVSTEPREIRLDKEEDLINLGK